MGNRAAGVRIELYGRRAHGLLFAVCRCGASGHTGDPKTESGKMTDPIATFDSTRPYQLICESAQCSPGLYEYEIEPPIPPAPRYTAHHMISRDSARCSVCGHMRRYGNTVDRISVEA